MSAECFADTAVPGGLWKLAHADLIVMLAGRNRHAAKLARRELDYRARMGRVNEPRAARRREGYVPEPRIIRVEVPVLDSYARDNALLVGFMAGFILGAGVAIYICTP